MSLQIMKLASSYRFVDPNDASDHSDPSKKGSLAWSITRGSCLELIAGTFNIGADISIPASTPKIIGAGIDLTILDLGTSSKFNTSSLGGANFENLTINGYSTTPSDGGQIYFPSGVTLPSWPARTIILDHVKSVNRYNYLISKHSSIGPIQNVLIKDSIYNFDKYFLSNAFGSEILIFNNYFGNENATLGTTVATSFGTNAVVHGNFFNVSTQPGHSFNLPLYGRFFNNQVIWTCPSSIPCLILGLDSFAMNNLFVLSGASPYDGIYLYYDSGNAFDIVYGNMFVGGDNLSNEVHIASGTDHLIVSNYSDGQHFKITAETGAGGNAFCNFALNGLDWNGADGKFFNSIDGALTSSGYISVPYGGGSLSVIDNGYFWFQTITGTRYFCYKSGGTTYKVAMTQL